MIYTCATKEVKTLEDAVLLQNDLERIYKWTADDNNMKLNDVKFELLRYGKNQEIKTQTSYTSPSSVEIESKDVVKDLGILMDNNCTFQKQIIAIIEKAKNSTSWILRTFSSRSLNCMITLYKSLVIPILEYCSVLWSPNAVGLIQRLEDIQKSFLRKINGTPNNYWECLKQTKIYSLQRQRERYRIMYVWKIMEKIVPPVNGIEATENPRLGHYQFQRTRHQNLETAHLRCKVQNFLMLCQRASETSKTFLLINSKAPWTHTLSLSQMNPRSMDIPGAG